LGHLSVRLVHGTAWMHDLATPVFEPSIESSTDNDFQDFDWFQPKKRSLLAPMGVGTIDQALMSVLHVRFGFLRLFGLAGKVLIIDEVHAYDAYMSEILELLLKWCNTIRLPVIMLSATLPARKRA
jgi:CRISPR-associated endonuclease/helicase Cas3